MSQSLIGQRQRSWRVDAPRGAFSFGRRPEASPWDRLSRPKVS